jgi:hypothetical protein
MRKRLPTEYEKSRRSIRIDEYLDTLSECAESIRDDTKLDSSPRIAIQQSPPQSLPSGFKLLKFWKSWQGESGTVNKTPNKASGTAAPSMQISILSNLEYGNATMETATFYSRVAQKTSFVHRRPVTVIFASNTPSLRRGSSPTKSQRIQFGLSLGSSAPVPTMAKRSSSEMHGKQPLLCSATSRPGRS